MFLDGQRYREAVVSLSRAVLLHDTHHAVGRQHSIRGRVLDAEATVRISYMYNFAASCYRSAS